MKKFSIFVLVLAVVLAMTACSTSTSSTSSNSSSTNGNGSTQAINTKVSFKMPPGDGVLNGMPQDILQNYNHFNQNVIKSPYANFKAVKKPWKIYYVGMVQNNAWQAAALKTLENDFAKYKEAGLVSEYVVTNPNGNLTTQIQQIQSAIEQGANLIITTPISPDALNGVIKQAYDAGIPVVTLAAPVTSPYALNINTNSFMLTATQAAGIVRTLHGKGNVLMVDGLAGMSSNTLMHEGAMAVFKQNPGIKIVGTINGDWSPSTAKTATLQFLATHPQKIDAVFQSGSMFQGIVEASKQAGRPEVPVSFGTPSQYALAYSHDHLNSGWQTIGTANSPWLLADAAFRIGILTLLGDGPKVNTFLQLPPEINNQNLNDWYKSSYTQSSTGIGEPPASTKWFSDTMLESLFNQKPTLPVATDPLGK